MAKKSLKDAAAAGTTVLDSIINGVQYVQDVQHIQNAQPAQDATDTKKKDPRGRKPSTEPLERLNLKIPTDIKEYLQAAAYRESSAKKTVSLTEYLCKLVREDMEKHKND